MSNSILTVTNVISRASLFHNYENTFIENMSDSEINVTNVDTIFQLKEV